MNNNHCDDLLDEGVYRKKNNETNKNHGRPFLVVNQPPESQITFGNTSHRIAPGDKSYSEALTNNSKSDSRNIKIFCDSLPKGISIKQLNQPINNGNARLHSFPGATSEQLLHFLDVNLDNSTDTVLIHIGINDVFNSISNVKRLLLNIQGMAKKCHNFGVKNICIWSGIHEEN